MAREVCPEIQYGDPNNLHSETFPDLKRVLVVGDSPYPGTHCWADIIAAAEAFPSRNWSNVRGESIRMIHPSLCILLALPGFPREPCTTTISSVL
jgi:hypothetical protein